MLQPRQLLFSFVARFSRVVERRFAKQLSPTMLKEEQGKRKIVLRDSVDSVQKDTISHQRLASTGNSAVEYQFGSAVGHQLVNVTSMTAPASPRATKVTMAELRECTVVP